MELLLREEDLGDFDGELEGLGVAALDFLRLTNLGAEARGAKRLLLLLLLVASPFLFPPTATSVTVRSAPTRLPNQERTLDKLKELASLKALAPHLAAGAATNGKSAARAPICASEGGLPKTVDLPEFHSNFDEAVHALFIENIFALK